MAVPLVLAGPIVRRVEPRLGAFWVALSRQASVEIRIWEGAQFAASGTGAVTGGAAVFATGAADTVRLGDQLHVALVQVKPQAPALPFGPGRIYSYDVIVTPSGGSATDLKAQGLLSDGATPDAHGDAPHHVALGYLTDRLPSFATAPTLIDDLKVVHSSCRNADGPGVDAMSFLDDYIEANVLDPTKRPHQLFLTGDQIYADSVPAPMLTMLNKVGRELLGRFEKLPIEAAQVEASLANFPALRRQKLINKVARMTSGSAANHLLSFAEYAAMYLCVWSNAPWQDLGTANDLFKAAPAGSTSDHLTPWDTECYDSLAEWKTKRAGDAKTKKVEEFRTTVAKTRRLLANVSTYMIFDDHEVTDDWNLAKAWQDRVFTSPLGGTILRNGLAAFTMFQGWGNDPAAYEKANSGNKKLIEAIPAMLAGTSIPAAAEAAKVDDVIGLDKSPSVDFHFSIDGPQHRVLALDTRTRRSFDGRLSPPKLLGSTLNKQIPSKPAAWDKEVLIVISPVPVLGPPLIDRVGQPLAMHMVDFKAHVLKVDPDKVDACKHPVELRGAEEYDAESWAFQEDHLEKMLERLAPYGSVVFLSGDVHYAMSATLDRWQKKDSGETSNRFIQLTSSPSRNKFQDAIAGFMRMSTFGVRAQRFGFPGERLAWKAKEPLNIPDGTTIAPGLRGRLRRAPVLVPADHWKPGITVKADRPPDWRWRMDIIADVRPNAQRADVAPHPPLGADIDTSDAIPGYFRTVSRHGIAALSHFDHMRQIVFPNNFGLVSFPDDAGTRVVRHELWSGKASDASKGTPNTVHQAPLGVPTAATPPELQNDTP